MNTVEMRVILVTPFKSLSLKFECVGTPTAGSRALSSTSWVLLNTSEITSDYDAFYNTHTILL